MLSISTCSIFQYEKVECGGEKIPSERTGETGLFFVVALLSHSNHSHSCPGSPQEARIGTVKEKRDGGGELL